MSEAQAGQLIEMMRSATTISYAEVSLPLFEVKRSSLEKLIKGDILVLPIKSLEVTIHEEGHHILSQGLYSVENNMPSIVIVKGKHDPVPSYDINKYEIVRISLGRVEKKEFAQGDIIRLQQNRGYDATLYRGERVIAYAHFVEVNNHAALQIKEVK